MEKSSTPWSNLMFTFYPMKYTLVSLGIAWLVRQLGVRTPIPRLALGIAVVLLLLDVGPTLVAACTSGLPIIVVVVVVVVVAGAVAAVSHGVFTEQRERLRGKSRQEPSPKRRHGGPS
jgi:peptidoglycan/LPS O-acetylase OafA/YrhL